jgi:hypothetical protein
LLEARPAEHRAALRGLEGNRRFRGALRTDRPGLGADTISGSSHTLDLALLTTLWIVFELLIVKEELLAGGKDKVVTAIRTFQNLIDEIHTRPPECAVEFFSTPSTNRKNGIFIPAFARFIYLRQMPSHPPVSGWEGKYCDCKLFSSTVMKV